MSMPDGTLGFANTSSKSNAIAPAPATPAQASAARNKPLTPEQELAEAQLRAALR
jgi:hypothetical protein